MTREDCWPVCMFCQRRFTLAPGAEPSRCESWRSPDGAHVERRVATPEQRARLRLETVPDMIFDTSTLMDPDDEPIGMNWRQRAKAADNMPAKAKPSPTPFDAAALRAGKPATGQTALF